MKRVLLCLLGVLLVMVEGSITNYINLFDVSFNIVLIYITIISLYLDELEVGIIGAVVGIVKDITIGGIFGVNALVLFAISYSISHLKDKIYKESYMTIFTLVLITSLFDSLVNIAALTLVYSSYKISMLALRGIVIIPLMNGLLSIVIYRLFKKSILKLKED
ncbi:rod shape-determining protein MreD [Romboutsia weinsteinii]|uniref:Rod shape-determining protein MreD n=1 Tax=Romboutsia weinsteinii TaxID=2020949 RepID=A0A371JA54_9FIRM|nr:rod shape-determining protein MreD [Romboutsia weinsteinii]RDY29635.1 rod shape-determining protein MreD [Romboutsia weinsteinii]